MSAPLKMARTILDIVGAFLFWCVVVLPFVGILAWLS
jgi:hypothetical protein